MRPWLLVHISGKPAGQCMRTKKLSSTAHVPLTSPDTADAGMPSNLLPSVVRVGGKRSGYIFCDQLGQAYLLRDEAIILDEEAWRGPDMRDESSMQRVVSFKVQTGETGDFERRFCLMGVLMRFEYFSKLFEGWQEGASSEVRVVDVDLAAFDQFLLYAQCGKLQDNLDLHMLVRMMRLGNWVAVKDIKLNYHQKENHYVLCIHILVTF